MLVLIHGVLEVFCPEERWRAIDQHVDIAVYYLLVGVQSHESFVRGNLDASFIFQFSS